MEEEKQEINFECKCCEYTTFLKSNYIRHNKSTKHLKNINGEKKENKIHKCELCEYETEDLSNFHKHLKSKSHLSKETGVKLKPIKHSYQCCWCSFSHTNPQSYIKHTLDCSEKPKTPLVIQAGINGIKNQLKKLTDKDYPRYASGDYITRDPEVIKEKIIFYEKKLKEEIDKYNIALKNPPKYDIEEIIKKELERNKCYKKMRDEEFYEMVNKIREEETESENEN